MKSVSLFAKGYAKCRECTKKQNICEHGLNKYLCYDCGSKQMWCSECGGKKCIKCNEIKIRERFTKGSTTCTMCCYKETNRKKKDKGMCY